MAVLRKEKAMEFGRTVRLRVWKTLDAANETPKFKYQP